MEIKDNKHKKVLSDSLFLTAGTFLLKLQSLLIMPIVIRNVGVDNYGIYIQATINASMISPIITFSLGSAIWRYTAKLQDWDKDLDQLSEDYWTVMQFSIVTGIIGTIILYLLSPILNEYILHGNEITLKCLQIASLLVFSNALWEQDIKFMQAFKETKLYTVLNNLRQLFAAILLAAAVIVYKNIFMGIAAFTLVQLCMGLYVFVHNALRLKFKLLSVSRLKKFIQFSYPLVPASIAGGISDKIDRYFIGYYYSAYEIGVYNMVYSIAGLLDDISIPFRRYIAVYLPTLWDSGGQEKVKLQIRESLLLYLIITIGLLIPMVFLTRPALELLLHKDLSNVKLFDMLVFVVGLGIIGEGSNRFLTNVIYLMEKNKYQLYFSIAGALLNIILCFLMVPTMGILGAGLATFLTFSFLSFLCNRKFSIGIDKDYISKLGRLVLTFFLVLLLSYCITHTSIIMVVVNFIIVIVTYVVLVHIFKITSTKKLLKKFGV